VSRAPITGSNAPPACTSGGYDGFTMQRASCGSASSHAAASPHHHECTAGSVSVSPSSASASRGRNPSTPGDSRKPEPGACAALPPRHRLQQPRHAEQRIGPQLERIEPRRRRRRRMPCTGKPAERLQEHVVVARGQIAASTSVSPR
jgi:hypothetical protein